MTRQDKKITSFQPAWLIMFLLPLLMQMRLLKTRRFCSSQPAFPADNATKGVVPDPQQARPLVQACVIGRSLMAADELQQLYTQGAIARRKISFVPAKKPTKSSSSSRRRYPVAHTPA